MSEDCVKSVVKNTAVGFIISVLPCLSLAALACRRCIHCVSKKLPTFKLSVTSSNVNRF